LYRLRDLKNGLYQIHSMNPSVAYEGTKTEIFDAAVKLGIKADELVIAAYELKKTGHDYAVFGSRGTFIVTRRNNE
jgi:hypothetical protein